MDKAKIITIVILGAIVIFTIWQIVKLNKKQKELTEQLKLTETK